MKRGFDNEKYLDSQEKALKKRIRKFKRLYLEVGGKLLYDDHAKRVLKGYNPKNKLILLKRLKEDLEIVYCVSARSVENRRRLKGGTYEKKVFSDLRNFEKVGLKNRFVVITMFTGREKRIGGLIKKLMIMKKRVVFHNDISGLRTKSLGEKLKAYQDQEPFFSFKKLIVVSAPASNSGKMSTIISQLYNDHRDRIDSGFAKLETFPIKELDPKHPINLAYEAATADSQDLCLEDPFHKKYYKKSMTNYNRDIENFDILSRILSRITGRKFPFGYKSPTDMGVNEVYEGIIDEEICVQASVKEVKRRYRFYKKEYRKGRVGRKTIKRMKEILRQVK